MMDNKKIWDNNWKQLGDYAVKSAGNRWAFYLIRYVLQNAQITPNATVIDYGCGIGAKTNLLAEHFPENIVYGFDFSDQAIENARKYFGHKSNLEFCCKDVHDMTQDVPENVEMVSAFELIEHIEDWEVFLTELCEISKKYVLLSTPTGKMREYEKQLGHYRNYRKGEIEDFMKWKGYSKVAVLYAGFPFWSPITRDVYNYLNTSEKHKKTDSGMEVSFNPLLHRVTYFVYRYFTSKKRGDQFVGLFEKGT